MIPRRELLLNFLRLFCSYELYISEYSVRHRAHNLLVSVQHNSPAYLDEDYPIVIDITNADDRELDVVVDVLLQPTEIDDAGQRLRLICRLIFINVFLI